MSTPTQDLEDEILTLLSADTAAAIRQYTYNALAEDLNISTQALHQMLDGNDPSTPTLGEHFFAKRVHQFV